MGRESTTQRPYDSSDADSIVYYATQLVGKTLREATGVDEIDSIASRKGSLGNAVEYYYFKFDPNSDPNPDFNEVGIELKTTPLKRTKKGDIVSKERLVLAMINYMEVVNNRAQMQSVAFAADMNTFNYINMNYWFYGLNAITTFTGIANLANVHEMQYAFSSCSGITSLDFRGFDTSELQSLQFTFSGCSNLVTIYADATWALPSSGLSGSQTFYNCNALVGGNGTTYASNRASYTYFRIDAASTPGYITA